MIYRFTSPDNDGVCYRNYPLDPDERAIALVRGFEAPTPLVEAPDLDLPVPAASLWQSLRTTGLPWVLVLRTTDDPRPRPVTDLRAQGLDGRGWTSWVWVGPTLAAGSRPRISLKRAHVLANSQTLSA